MNLQYFNFNTKPINPPNTHSRYNYKCEYWPWKTSGSVLRAREEFVSHLYFFFSSDMPVYQWWPLGHGIHTFSNLVTWESWSFEGPVIIRGDQMFQTSSCDRKLPTHSKCHAEFWADFLFPFPFSPLSNFFSSKSIQKLLPKLSSSIVVLMTSFPSPTPPCLSSHGQSLPLFPWTASMPACTSFPPLFLASLHQLLHRIVIFDVPVLRCLSIFTSNKESLPILPSQMSHFSSKPIPLIYSLLKNILYTFCLPSIVLGTVRRGINIVELPGSHSSWVFVNPTGIHSPLDTKGTELQEEIM